MFHIAVIFVVLLTGSLSAPIDTILVTDIVPLVISCVHYFMGSWISKDSFSSHRGTWALK